MEQEPKQKRGGWRLLFWVVALPIGLFVVAAVDGMISRGSYPVYGSKREEYARPEPPGSSGSDSYRQQTMSFDECLTAIRGTAAQLGVAPVNIVETASMRVVKWNTVDGSVLMTCDGANRSMSVSRNPR